MGWWKCVVLLLAVAFTLDGAQGQVCNSQVDLMMVVDGSTGLTASEFDRLKTLVIEYVRSKSETSTQSTLNAGYVVVSENVDAQLEPTTRYADFADSLSKVPFTAGRSLVTSSAIETAFSNLLNANSPTGTPKIMIVLVSQTSSNQVRTRTIANLARQYSTTIWGVGLKNMDQSELLVIAGDQSTLRTLVDVQNAASLPSINLNLRGVDCGKIFLLARLSEPDPGNTTADNSSANNTKTDNPSANNTKADYSKTNYTKTDNSSAYHTNYHTQTNHPKTNYTKTDNPSANHTKADYSKTKHTKTDNSTTIDPKTDNTKTNNAPADAAADNAKTGHSRHYTAPNHHPDYTGQKHEPPHPSPNHSAVCKCLCQDAVIVSGVGIRGHPVDPEKYIQCYFPQSLGGSRRRRRRQINTGYVSRMSV
ncbi:LOW QUALITY PROTEIN: collagen alpha-3(VI) chain [Elysia marginata]|uniref:Collagen alpha-3(VI) chain n=1 Tax=Elysia marginata TaxID=1093978 RepID=A0AAV4FJG7_9GAST|nr:LOW QUALITY PROTEIN: collagen alpha-3(VI) chain [Elysia marginata]